jgi:hypothetical protein
MNKFEKLIEYIINDDDQKARELFHSIVVEKSRDIYESIMDEEQVGEMVQGDQVGNMVDEIEGEESTMEGDDEMGDDEMGDDEMGDDEMGGAELGGDQSHEDTVMSIDAKLDELLAKFDEISGDKPGSGMGSSSEFDAGEEGEGEEGDFGGDIDGEEEVAADETGMMEGENPFAKSGKSGKSSSAVSGKSGSAASGMSGSAKSGKSGKPFESTKSTAQLMREYVDTIGNIYGGEGDASEGDAVGATGKKTSVNAKSTSLTSGPNFGGTSANIVGKKGATNENPDGKQIPKPSNEYNKGQGEIKSGNVNVPGGKAGAPKSTGHEYTKDAKGAEGKTTSGTVPVAKKSVQVQNTGKKK